MNALPLLLALSASARLRAPAAAVRAGAAVPALRLSVPALGPSSAPVPAPATLPALALAAPADAPRLSREAARDEAAARLVVAGLPSLLAEHGLVAWHILPHRARSGPRVWVTVSLPRDGRPFAHGSGDEGRREELSRRLDAARERATALVAAALGIPADDVAFNERLIEGCCGAGCQSCLLTKKDHARAWTGEKPRPERD